MGSSPIVKTGRTICISLAAVSLVAGSAIYILFRPTSLLMFQWFNAIGLMGKIEALRNNPPIEAYRLPPWVIFSLPFALWVLSYMLCIETIWWRSRSHWRDLWFWCVAVVSIVSEFCQLLGVLPGTFDLADLLAIGIAVTFGVAVDTFKQTVIVNRKELI